MQFTKLAKVFWMLSFAVTYLSTEVKAQKVKLDDYKVKAEHVEFPLVGLPLSYTTYHLDIDFNERQFEGIGYSRKLLTEQINFPNLFKVNLGGAIGLKVIIDVISSESSPVTVGGKGKDATHVRVPYSVTTTAKVVMTIKDKTDVEVIYESKDDSQFREVEGFFSNTFPQMKDLQTYWINNRTNILKSQMKKSVGARINMINTLLKRKYGLKADKSKVEYFTLKEKSHPEYGKWQAMDEIVKQAFEALKMTDKSAFQEIITPALQFWQENEKNLRTSNEEEAKLVYACQMNLANTYAWLADFDLAISYASKVAGGKYDPKDGKKLVEKLQETKNRMDQLGWTSRNFLFTVNEEDAQRFEEEMDQTIAAIDSGAIYLREDFKKKTSYKLGSKTAKAVIYGTAPIAGIEGYLVFESETDDVDFLNLNTSRFGYLKDENIEVSKVLVSKIDSIRIGGHLFVKKDVKIGSGLFSAVYQSVFLLLVKDFEKTSYYQCFHSQVPRGLDRSKVTNFSALYHKTKNIYVDPNQQLVKFSTLLERAFSDCGDVMDQAYVTYRDNKNSSYFTPVQVNKLNELDNLMLETMENYDGCK